MDISKKLTAFVTLAAMIVAPLAMAAPADLTVDPIACAAPCIHPRVTAKVPASAVSGQVFFKADGTTNEYYVDMRKAADGTMWAFLPAPAPATRSFTYRVVTLDAAGKRASSPLMTLNTSASCPTSNVASNERAAQTAIVVGLTSNAQPIVPVGFLCTDIASYITVSGEMRTNEECRRLLAANGPCAGAPAGGVPTTAGAAPAAAATQGAGGLVLSRSTIVALTAIGVVGGGALYYNNHNKKQKSQSRP
ncbi:MAG: hypothetical protein ACXV7D_00435 [Thermoanaerobaculia bacterium]